MKKKAARPMAFAALRGHAEKRLQAHPRVADETRTGADTQRLVHELQVHQIELEMQNTELQRARLEAETALGKYTELYDFAPVGYFSIDQQGLIQEVNLTGSALFGTARTRLIHQRLQRFVSPTSLPVVAAFLKKLFSEPGKQTCEALLLTATDATFWADLQAVPTLSPKNGRAWCRLAISDIAALKRGEEAQRSVQALAAANQEANREIARRRAVENALKKSEHTQRALLAESLKLHAQLRHLTHQVLLVQEEERKQISRELHDDIAQILAGINLRLTTLALTAAVRPGDLQRQIAKAKRQVGQSIEVIHRFARKLRPTLLDDLGIVPALRSLVKELDGSKGLQIRFIASTGVGAVGSPHRTMLYRVAQEALTNVVRHAHAKTASVHILKTPGAIRLEIRDDGRAFSIDKVKHCGRLGLLGMQERVEMVGGRLSIESTPGQGTVVTAEMPTAVRRRRLSPRKTG
jgi:PAS domain S-box-containing protein